MSQKPPDMIDAALLLLLLFFFFGAVHSLFCVTKKTGDPPAHNKRK